MFWLKCTSVPQQKGFVHDSGASVLIRGTLSPFSAMATAEQMLAALAASVTQMADAMKVLTDEKTKKTGESKRLLDNRHRQVPKLEANGSFDDWAFAFRRFVRAMDRKAYELMVRVEAIPATTKDMMEDLELEYPDGDVRGYSAEIFDLLCQAVSGEALQLVRAVEDMEGLEAWAKIVRKYNPRSMARAVRLVGQVTNPPKIVDLAKVESELDKWEELVRTMKKDFKEEFSDTVKVGIVTTMMPQSVQEFVYQSIGSSVKYDDMVEKIRALVSNKVAMSARVGPTPMDVGEVCDEDSGDDEIGAVSMNTQCHACGGWGHFRRDCPTAAAKGTGKGKGKSPESGKGGQPSWMKGGGKGAKGGTKGGGFKGACFLCGKTGHRAVECRSRQANAVDEDEPWAEDEQQEEVPLGGVWAVGAVDVGKKTTPSNIPVPPGLFGRSATCRNVPKSAIVNTNHPQNRNRFHVLGLDADEEVEEAELMAVDPAKPLTRLSTIEFNVADVRKPLASAAKMVQQGNRVVLDSDGSYIQNKSTGECMQVKLKDETFVFDVQYENGEAGAITLDSGAGVHVWPKNQLKEVPLLPRKPGLRMSAANGTEIANLGRKVIRFRGNDFARATAESSVFSRRV